MTTESTERTDDTADDPDGPDSPDNPDDPDDPDVPNCYCELTGVIDLLSRRYAMQVVCVVGALETVRFRDLETHLPDASTSTLSARLSDLVEAGLLARTQYDEIPPRVEYVLTDEGRELCERLLPVLEWAGDRPR